jgi:hypothetical protein
MRALKAILIGAGLCLAAGHVAGCDQTPPIDEHFDSSLGADFKPPVDTRPDGGASDAGDAAAATAP